MKKILTTAFWPILVLFETDIPPTHYKRSHRVVLIAVGVLFLTLSLGSGLVGYHSNELGALFPVLIFSAAGLVSVVLGALGSDGAVAKMWGNK